MHKVALARFIPGKQFLFEIRILPVFVYSSIIKMRTNKWNMIDFEL